MSRSGSWRRTPWSSCRSERPSSTGPHLPVGTDAWHAQHVARGAASRLPDDVTAIVTPTLSFGSSDMHMPFGGTISLPTRVYYETVNAIAESLVADGFRRLFLLNGHGGNHELVTLVARDLALHHPVVVAAGSWWNMAWDVLVEAGALEVASFPGHAGAFETSFVQATRPDIALGPLPSRPRPPEPVDPRRLYELDRIVRSDFWTSIEGFTDSPAAGSAELGRRWLDVAIAEVARRFEAVARSPLPD